MKLAVVVIWYNPDSTNKDNILTYSSVADKIYIIDNSSISHQELAEGIPNCVYIANFENKGIAAAQNTGCALALQEGFEWCMTMDQDSIWSEDMLDTYIKRVAEYVPENRYWSFAPDTTDVKTTFLLKKIVHGLKYFLKKDHVPDIQTVDAVIASGNIINLNKWQEVGSFNESYFIDSVDHEFCLKLNALYPDSILLFNDIKLTHSLGDAHFSILTRFDFHSGVRLYYMTRNVLYLKNAFPDFVKKHGLTRKLIFIYIQNMRDFRYRDCSFMKQGYLDWKAGKKGPYTKN